MEENMVQVPQRGMEVVDSEEMAIPLTVQDYIFRRDELQDYSLYELAM